MAISDFPPYFVVADRDYGLHGKIIFDALKKTGQAYEVKVFSWSKITQMLSSENVCSFAWLKNAERLNQWHFSQPYYKDVSFFWGRKDNPITINRIEDVKKYKLGVTRSYSYGEEMDALLKLMHVDESLDDEINVRKLLARRIELFVSQKMVIKQILKKTFPHQVDVLEPKFKIDNVRHHFVCHKNFDLGKRTIERLNMLLPSIE